jgi:hypothetical protein
MDPNWLIGLVKQISLFTTLVAELQDIIQLVGGLKDSSSLRETLSNKREEAKALELSISNKIPLLQSSLKRPIKPNDENYELMELEKQKLVLLIENYSSVTKFWKELYKESYKKETMFPMNKPRKTETIPSQFQDGSLQSQKQEELTREQERRRMERKQTKQAEFMQIQKLLQTDPSETNDIYINGQKLIQVQHEIHYSSKDDLLKDIVQERNRAIAKIKVNFLF